MSQSSKQLKHHTNNTIENEALSTHDKSHRPELTTKFVWIYILFALWMNFGAHIDSWSHNNIPEVESFFTPFHAILYSGYMALFGYLLYYWVRHYTTSQDIFNSLPDGFNLSFFGGFIFFIGGFGDMVWHTYLGIEVNVEALYSPTHLLLAIGAALLVSGPIRHMWRNPHIPKDKNYRTILPYLLSISIFLSIITFYLQFAMPYNGILPAGYTKDGPANQIGNQGIGVLGTIIFTILFVMLVFNLQSRFDLPFGSYATILSINGLFMTMIEYPISGLTSSDVYIQGEQVTRIVFIILSLFLGISCDITLSDKFVNLSYSLLIISTLLPLLYFLFYLIIIDLTIGLMWSIHMVAGLPLIAAITGYLTLLTANINTIIVSK